MNLEELILPLKTEDNAFRANISRATMLVGQLIETVGKAVVESVGLASDLSETISKTSVVFGDSSKKILAWGKNSAKALGMSNNTALSAAATFGNLFRAMKITEETSADMSIELVELAADLASFNNMDPTEVLDKLRAGLSGETEPLRALGVNLNQALIEEKALEMGLWDGVDALDAAGKAQASYALILEQTSLAQGDFERTSEGLANQQRIMAAQWENLKTILGTAFLPLFTKVTSKFNDFLEILINPDLSLSSKLSEIATQLDEFVGNIFQGLADAINEWAAGDGPEQLTDQIVSFIERIGTGEGIDSKALIAAQNLLSALGRAFLSVDWADIDAAMDVLDARVMASFDELDADILAWFDQLDADILAALDNLNVGVDGKLAELDIAANAAFLSLVKKAGDTIKSGLNSIDENFANWSTDVVATIRKWGTEAVASMGEAINRLEADIARKLANISEIFQMRARSWINKAVDSFNGQKQALISAVQGVVDAINNVLKKVITSFTLRVSWPGSGSSSSTGTSGTSSIGGPTPGDTINTIGGRASGGPVIKGQSYPVAEFSRLFNRPEVFTPNSSGRIDQMDSGPQSVVILNWNDFDYQRLATENVKAVNNA